METQIKFSDIIRYILLGAVVCVSFYLFFAAPINAFVVTMLGSEEGTIRIQGMDSGEGWAVIYLVVFLAVSFFSGLILQTLRIFIEGKMIRWIRVLRACCERQRRAVPAARIADRVLSTLIYGSLFQVCHRLKRKGVYRPDIPYWVYLSLHPETMLARLGEKVGQGESTQGGESLYYNHLFLGMSFLALVLTGVSLLQQREWWLVCSLAFTAVAARSVARMYIIKYIRCVHVAALADEVNMLSLLGGDTPHVYILMRTLARNWSASYFSRAIESVEMQDYPNKTIILLEDLPAEGASARGAVPAEVERTLRRLSEKGMLLFKQATEHLGASGASMEIRRHFLREASPGDVAVLLDDDDRFARPDALSDVVVRMCATRADICLTAFANVEEMGYVLSNNGGYYHNKEVVGTLSRYSRAKRYRRFPRLRYSDTLGWTKCYRYQTLQRYCESIDACDATLPPDRRFAARGAYEDFCDFICYMFASTRVTAVERPVYCYCNRAGSVTGMRTRDAFRLDRIHFLAYLRGLVAFCRSEGHPRLMRGAEEQTDAFISYKIGVIRKILLDHRATVGYPPAAFLTEVLRRTGLQRAWVLDQIRRMVEQPGHPLKYDPELLAEEEALGEEESNRENE